MTAPVVVFEVLSPGDETRDRVEKAADCLRIESIQTYVILSSDRAQITILSRDGEEWAQRELDLSGKLFFQAVRIEVPVAELSADVTF